MDISSATSVLPQPRPTPATPVRAEESVEGNTPDNDGDKDDTVNTATQVTNVSGAVGTKINIAV
ncbi:MAG: hypothetical protein L3J75_14250 [Methylococcaceae bacterium]|nr:hypothetical protein [Methylococcaceae bacterium]